MERYDLVHGFLGAEIEKIKNGQWVKYEEAEKRIKELEDALKSVEEWYIFGNHIDDEVINIVLTALNK